MIKLILCEGKSDVILLSYYLHKTSKWEYSKKAPIEYDFNINEKNNECMFWYRRGDEFLLICGVGGKNLFSLFYNKNFCPLLNTGFPFDKIAFVVDRDEESIEDICTNIGFGVKPSINTINVGKWSYNEYFNFYNEKKNFNFLLVIVPQKEHGSLENVLLQALKEIDEGTIIVQDSISFVDDISIKLTKYLIRDRIKLKAYLSVALAVISPEKVFSTLDEMIKSVNWEEFDIVAQCFNELRNI